MAFWPFLLPLFTQVPGRGILGTSAKPYSRKFAVTISAAVPQSYAPRTAHAPLCAPALLLLFYLKLLISLTRYSHTPGVCCNRYAVK